MYNCQACGKPLLEDLETRWPCPGCSALLYCSSKHRSRHIEHEHDAEECARMSVQMMTKKDLELPFFTWWYEVHQCATGAADTSVLPARCLGHHPWADLDTMHTLIKSSSDPPPQPRTWAAIKQTSPGIIQHPQLVPAIAGEPRHADSTAWEQQQATTSAMQLPNGTGCPQQYTFNTASQREDVPTWQSCYELLDLPPHSPAALVLHFAASLAHALVHPCLRASIEPGQDTSNAPHQQRQPVRSPPCSVSTCQHVLYLGPEVELHVLDTFRCLYCLLPQMRHLLQTSEHVTPVQTTEPLIPAGPRTVGPSCNDATCQQLWIHFIGPGVPPTWSGQSAWLVPPVCRSSEKGHTPSSSNPPGQSQPDLSVEQPGQHPQDSSCQTSSSAHTPGVHISFWQGCLHEVQGELVSFLTAVCRLHQTQHNQSRDASPDQQDRSKRARVAGSGQHDNSCPPTKARDQALHMWQMLCPANSLVWAPNSGLVAYDTWQPTLDLLSLPGAPPLLTTDYCEEALVKARAMCSTLFPQLCCILPPQPNPLRQPLQQSVHGNRLPAYSNGFIMGLAAST